MSDKTIKIGFCTHRDARDKREWSGTLYYMADSLARNVGDVVHLGPYYPRLAFFLTRGLNKFCQFILRKQYNFRQSLFLSKAFQMRFDKRIKKYKPDVVVAPASSTDMCLLKSDVPLIYLGDATFPGLKDYYPNFSNLIQFSNWESKRLEEITFKKSKALVFSSEWAYDSAINDFGVPKEKMEIISYGANLDKIPSFEDAVNKNTGGSCHLLFLGVDWFRKGGYIAYNAMLKLIEKGIDAKLTVCGCKNVPKEVQHPNLTVISFLNKNTEDGFAKLYNLLLNTHFMVVPTRADCTPIVFCEANSFAIPVVTTHTGGVPSVIKHGINGFTLDMDDEGEGYAAVIREYFSDNEKYKTLVANSRKTYDEQLNWDTWGVKMNALIKKVLNQTA